MDEPRDLYDVWYLTAGGHVDLEFLRGEVEDKLAFRDHDLPGTDEEPGISELD